ncbi:MAG TPA: DUF6370 family protein [Isosphaeraceae bacterium]|nr:DUF6370 family protein [Isosphaeraceae bacterium]
MRKLIPMLAVAVLFSGVTLVIAAEKTIKGTAECAKCTLKETKQCQTAVKVEEGGKTVTYYLTQTAAAKKFHKNICPPGSSKKVEVTGDAKEVDGKQVIEPETIEIVEE